ncbi:MFS transporter [Xylanibacillus composti]|uniref:MFS transporter n=1 Tax=Xylanibacillus composti TaxID=1572762 RepID=A0A8J4H4S5_9BACL|nr:DHA2 family efflux MFS transporter permease subunit [Xylanibacillus composti]GIQ69640.1 MFS transporter [Xylanibacillus composti]
MNARLWLAFASLGLGIFMVNMDSAMLTMALPRLEKEWEVPLLQLKWLVLGYLILITGLLPSIGRLSDRAGKKRIYMLGVSLFTVSTLLCAGAGSFWQLLLFRLLQAIGASMIMANAMSLVTQIFPQGLKGRALSGISSVIAVATILGPAVGGLLLHLSSWRAVFLLHLPLGIAALLLSILHIPAAPQHKPAGQSFDYVGAVAFFVAMAGLLSYLSWADTLGWASAWAMTLLGGSLGMMAFFIYWQARAAHPLLELSLFRKSRFIFANLASYLSFVLTMLPAVVLPLYLIQVMQISEDTAGALISVQAVAIVLAAPVSGWMTDKLNGRIPAAVGMLCCAAGLGLLSGLEPGTGYGSIVLALGLFGLGIGLFQAPNQLAVLQDVPPDKNGAAGSIMATIRNFGRVSGTALAFLLYASSNSSPLQGSGQVAAAGNVQLVFLAGCVLAFITILLQFGDVLKFKHERASRYSASKLKQ